MSQFNTTPLHENLISEPPEIEDDGESSGIVTYDQDGRRKAITAVINAFELEGDEVRANLLQAMRNAIMESQRTIGTLARAIAQRQRRHA